MQQIAAIFCQQDRVFVICERNTIERSHVLSVPYGFGLHCDQISSYRLAGEFVLIDALRALLVKFKPDLVVGRMIHAAIR